MVRRVQQVEAMQLEWLLVTKQQHPPATPPLLPLHLHLPHHHLPPPPLPSPCALSA